jgi:DNA-binding response OmpR family regulator
MTKKLLIAADADLCAALRELFLSEPDFTLREGTSAQEALGAIEAESPDALLIAEDLEDANATLLRRARALGFEGPALLLTRRDTAAESEFDAVLHRPFRFAELVGLIGGAIESRARALSDRAVSAATQTLLGPDGEKRVLTEKETAILSRLARARGEVVPRDVLLRDVWGYNASVATHTLETHIHRLRRKIEGGPGRPRLLVTAQGGYRLTTAGDRVENVEADA